MPTYRELAFVTGCGDRHEIAMQERALWLAKRCNVTLTPLETTMDALWRRRYDLVIVASEERRRFGKVFVQGTEQRLIRCCPSPVLIVRHRAAPPSGRTVVAIDPDPIDNSRMLLAA